MATPWCRLWAEMPNDPKWRTIARISGQRIGDVIATYVHMLTCASNATERGRTEGWSNEDVATALDLDIEQVVAIREVMQGRVRDGDYLTGWEKRQPAREDGSAAARAKAWREEQKRMKAESSVNAVQTHANASEHKQTTEVDTDTDKDKSREELKSKAKAAPKARKPAKTVMPDDFAISPAVQAWAAAKGHADLQAHFESFVRKAKANGYAYANWDQALQNAVIDDWAKLRAPNARSSPGQGRAPVNGKFHFGDIDRSGDVAAMAANMQRRGITVPEGDEVIEL